MKAIHPKAFSLSSIVARSPQLDRICRQLLFKKIEGLHDGELIIVDQTESPTLTQRFGKAGHDLSVTVKIHRSSFYSRTLIGGSIGNAESYIDGDWHTDQLTELVRLFVRNRELLEALDGGLGALLNPVQKIFHGLRGNTIEGSRQNIRDHYDIGNDFFKLFLDETMMYSSAIFETPERTLHEASLKKIHTVCQRLRLAPGDHLVEVGTGWGSLAITAARDYGARVTTTTISQEQFDYAREKVREHKLEGKVDVIFEDYRNLKGSYDRLVSVEMIEAVGLDNLDDYFQKCSSLLKEHGLMVLQAITIRDQYYESARRSVDFIQRHIFPGGGLPSMTAMLDCVSRKTDLMLTEQKDYAEDYAQTLRLWAENLNRRSSDITKLGYPDFLHRLWQYYFSYCEGGFRERAIGVSHLTLAKKRYRDRSFA